MHIAQMALEHKRHRSIPVHISSGVGKEYQIRKCDIDVAAEQINKYWINHRGNVDVYDGMKVLLLTRASFYQFSSRGTHKIIATRFVYLLRVHHSLRAFRFPVGFCYILIRSHSATSIACRCCDSNAVSTTSITIGNHNAHQTSCSHFTWKCISWITVSEYSLASIFCFRIA